MKVVLPLICQEPIGYAQIGKRCYGSCDWHARGRVNVIGTSINMELISVGLFDSYIDSDVFYQWTIEFLLPALKQSSVIVLDNAAFHKRNDIQQAIIDAGHILIYLPPYSPDLNPIEHKWAQAKSMRRKLRCDVDTLFLNILIKSIYKSLAIDKKSLSILARLGSGSACRSIDEGFVKWQRRSNADGLDNFAVSLPYS